MSVMSLMTAQRASTADSLSTDPTVEHFHAVSRGGRNHPDNCALACEPCNLIAANKPIVEKVWLREIIQAAVSNIPPWEHFDARRIEGGRP